LLLGVRLERQLSGIDRTVRRYDNRHNSGLIMFFVTKTLVTRTDIVIVNCTLTAINLFLTNVSDSRRLCYSQHAPFHDMSTRHARETTCLFTDVVTLRRFTISLIIIRARRARHKFRNSAALETNVHAYIGPVPNEVRLFSRAGHAKLTERTEGNQSDDTPAIRPEKDSANFL